MKISSLFPTKYLREVDVPVGKPVLLTINRVEAECFDSTDDGKPVLYFEEIEKGLILGKTNSLQLAESYGDETDAWNGKPVILFRPSVGRGPRDDFGRYLPRIWVNVPNGRDETPEPTRADGPVDLDKAFADFIHALGRSFHVFGRKP